MEEKNEVLNEIIEKIGDVMKIVLLYQPSKPLEVILTKLEEAILWSNVLTQKIPKKCMDPTPVENKDQTIQ